MKTLEPTVESGFSLTEIAIALAALGIVLYFFV